MRYVVSCNGERIAWFTYIEDARLFAGEFERNARTNQIFTGKPEPVAVVVIDSTDGSSVTYAPDVRFVGPHKTRIKGVNAKKAGTKE